MPHTASYDLCSCLLLLLSRLARICSKLMSGRQPVGDSISGSSMRWAPGGGGGREHKVTGGGGRVGEGGPGSRRAVAGWQAGRWKAGRRKQAGGHRPPGRKVGRQAGGRAGRQAGRRAGRPTELNAPCFCSACVFGNMLSRHPSPVPC